MKPQPLTARDVSQDCAPDCARDNARDAGQAPSLEQLTPRQRQIVELLRAGKVNKEIARELGIGVGTVKQHVVTLFRRLNVSNRTMAVMALAGQGAAAAPSGGAQAGAANPANTADPVHAAQGALAAHAAPGVARETDPAAAALERRPCVLLSLGVAAGAGEAALRRLHALLAAQACDTDAVFLARRGQAGDLIFGLHQVGESDLHKAVESARRLYAELQAQAPELAPGLRGGMTVGEVMASMLRQGGWSGEAMASTALAAARALQEQAAPGQMLLGRPVLALMQALGIRGEKWFGAGAAPGAVGFDGLDAIDWRNDRHCYPLVGRGEQRAALAGLLQGGGRLVLLEAETGMGKSRLCAEALALWRAAGRQAGLCRVAPHSTIHRPGSQDDCSAALALLQKGAGTPPALAVVDDCHLLTPAARRAVVAAAQEAVAAGVVVLLSGRAMAEMASLQAPGVLRLALPRLSADDTAALAAQVLAGQADDARRPQLIANGTAVAAAALEQGGSMLRQIAADAAGVPLFAVELARHSGEQGMAVSLLATVCARLDGLHLDRKLLRAAARLPAPTLAGLAAAMGESEATVAALVQRAQAAGVLRAGPGAALEFGHPLLRKIIDYLSIE
jgi:DNA-binding CsgD family transcriptional regulator